MKGKYQGSVTSLGGRCCDVRAAAERNAKQMQTSGDDKEKKVDKKYKGYYDLIA